MITRRQFISRSLLAGAAILAPSSIKRAIAADFMQKPGSDLYSAKTVAIFNNIIKKAAKGNWKKLEIGELVVKVAEEFIGTPYAGGTLEGPGPEICRIDLTGLDCVTLFENSLDIARIIKFGKKEFDDLVNEVSYTRYREGKLDGYPSRLHYTSDWIYDNTLKGVVRDITKEIGGVKFKFKALFMSKNPQYYDKLQNDPEMVKIIAGFESAINSRDYYYIPKNDLHMSEELIKTGDIIAISTSKSYLDYAHTGIAIASEGQVKFLHASSVKKQVVIEESLQEYLDGVKTDTGITVARPVEIISKESK